MKKCLVLLVLLITSACTYIHITKGNETEKMKVDALVSDNCKVRVKYKYQRLRCVWKF